MPHDCFFKFNPPFPEFFIFDLFSFIPLINYIVSFPAEGIDSIHSISFLVRKEIKSIIETTFAFLCYFLGQIAHIIDLKNNIKKSILLSLGLVNTLKLFFLILFK